jgi:hypothetical protein
VDLSRALEDWVSRLSYSCDSYATHCSNGRAVSCPLHLRGKFSPTAGTRWSFQVVVPQALWVL